MFKGAAWGNKTPEFESLSIEELSAWIPDLSVKLEEIGITTVGQEKSSLGFICENAGFKPSDIIAFLSNTEDNTVLKDIHIDTIKIIPGKDKSGNKEPIDELVINKGEVVAVVGPTGSGKSQLLSDIESLCQGTSPSGRKLLMNNEIPSEELIWSPSLKPIAQISQSMNFLLDITVDEFIELHTTCRNTDNIETLKEEVLDTACSLCGESFSLQHQLVSLSGGQSRALMIADAILVSRSPIVLIDEIENAGINREKAMEFLLNEGNITFIATHDPLIALYADKRLIVKNGAISQIIEKSPDEEKTYNWLREREKEFSSLRTQLRSGELLLQK